MFGEVHRVPTGVVEKLFHMGSYSLRKERKFKTFLELDNGRILCYENVLWLCLQLL